MKQSIEHNKGYVISLHTQKSVGTHWIYSCSNDDSATCFDNFSVKLIAVENKRFKDDNNIIMNILRIQAYNSIP